MLVLVMQCLFVRSVLKHSWEWIGIGANWPAEGDLWSACTPIACSPQGYCWSSESLSSAHPVQGLVLVFLYLVLSALHSKHHHLQQRS